MGHAKRILGFILISLLVVGCIGVKVVPKEEIPCQVHTKELTLDLTLDNPGTELAAMWLRLADGCDSAECVLIVTLGALAIPVTSFIVSGSIVVVGNTVHWLEEQGTCEDSITQQAVQTLAESTEAAGGTVMESSTEFLHWLEQQLGPVNK